MLAEAPVATFVHGDGTSGMGSVWANKSWCLFLINTIWTERRSADSGVGPPPQGRKAMTRLDCSAVRLMLTLLRYSTNEAIT